MPFRDVGLLSPATVGADDAVSDDAVLQALVDVEAAYSRALGGEASTGAPDPESVALRARDGGNPVIPLIADLRSAAGAGAIVHTGATSQDILDSALMLLAARARGIVLVRLGAAITSLARLADEHRGTVAAARTLTQHAVPTTYGLRFATWLTSLLDARDDVRAVVLPVQLGGAAGTLASLVQLGHPDAPAALARELGLAESAPWHVSRAPITRLGDALTRVTDACGTIGANVATLSRTEIGELAEPAVEGRGGSSAMPQKHNPVLSVLLRSVSLRAPGLASTLHVSAASFVDERPDGAWHAEWPTLRELLRLALGGSALLEELLGGLTVDLDAVARNLALDDLRAEQRSLGGSGGEYTGLSDRFIDAALERARA